MKIHDIVKALELLAPLSLQEPYDNAGLLVGNKNQNCIGALITLDVTEIILDEAIAKKANLIISHHPLIFGGIKKVTLDTATERIVTKAIKNDIAIYAIHTNLDNSIEGVNAIICSKLQLVDCKILDPGKKQLRKLITYCPTSHTEKVREALFLAGAGQIGNYDSCSFNAEGIGTFKALAGANPFVGNIDQLHKEEETRIETIFPFYKEKQVINALFASHPYEEVAYDIYLLENNNPTTGAGMIGKLPHPITEIEFLKQLKETFFTGCIKHSQLTGKKIEKVAVCGGSGSFLSTKALHAGADAFVTGDIKYHDFFMPEGRILLADIGHYESEQYTKELLLNHITKIFPTFAVLISENNTNSVHYF
ncbi:MAG: Nif3-like dinuclear metal center hexameric protein [Bacteroidetes bacterium]|nr:Nif3-like dinuclear metal center hexameric protein [Bacteroidota bacterium]